MKTRFCNDGSSWSEGADEVPGRSADEDDEAAAASVPVERSRAVLADRDPAIGSCRKKVTLNRK